MINLPAPLFRSTETASILRVSISTLDKLRNTGQIEYLRIEGQIRFTQDQIDRYIARAVRRAPSADDLEDAS